MRRVSLKIPGTVFALAGWLVLSVSGSILAADDEGKNQGPPPVPVRVAKVQEKMVSEQVSLVGSTGAVAASTVAAEVPGVVEFFPVKEGDFVKKGDLLARLRSKALKIRLKGAVAGRENIRSKLEYAEKDLERFSRLKDTNSIAATKYDEAFYNHAALSQELRRSEADIEYLKYEITQKNVVAPFSGFVAKEHTQVGEWINLGGAVVDLVDLGKIEISVDVPERYAVLINTDRKVGVRLTSVSGNSRTGRIDAILPQGDPASRTFPVKVSLDNPNFKIKSGMEAMVTFHLAGQKSALLVPKDAVVTAGDNRLVIKINDGKAIQVPIKTLGHYDGDVAVEGSLQPGDRVVIRGNERLRPGQPVTITD